METLLAFLIVTFWIGIVIVALGLSNIDGTLERLRKEIKK